jgi:light-regulated signal transduction histidine kinase (bacteriophytochrome)
MFSSHKYSKALFLIIGLLLIVIVGAMDFLTGPEIEFSIFYIFVAAYFAWFLGLWAGIAASVILAVISVMDDICAGLHYSHIAVPFWMAIVRSAVFSGIVFFLLRLRNRETELKGAIEKLQQANRELDYFTSMVSHDLQSPLQTVSMFCQLLDKKISATAKDSKEYLSYIRESITRMQQLIIGLLSYAKITQNTGQLELVNLKGLISESLQDLDALVKEKKAEIKIGELPQVQANPLKMRQLFQNLISNAIKYSKKEVPPRVKIDSQVSADAVEVYVRDNGIGFDERYVNRIFLPFQRLQSDVEGAGIGLSTCKKIVEQHGGSMTAKSKPGEGSVFAVRLPRRIILN